MNPSIFLGLKKFFTQTEKLKTVIRHSSTSDLNRKESVAEHSWHLSLVALTVFEHLDQPVDQLKVLKMLIIHDLAEIVTGDIPTFNKQKLDKQHIADQELKAFEHLIDSLTPSQKQDFLALYKEFEDKKTLEAKLAKAIDKLEAVIQHNIADISTWDQNDLDYHPYCKNDYFDFDSFLRFLKDQTDLWSMHKIETAGKLSQVDPKHTTKYKIDLNEPKH